MICTVFLFLLYPARSIEHEGVGARNVSKAMGLRNLCPSTVFLP
jgi:hypothetical protein